MANRDAKILCLLFISFSFSINPCFSDPRTFEAALICGNTTAPTSDRQQFIANFLATFDSISPLVNRQRYGTVVNGTGNNTVYTFGQCMRDLSANDCHLCFAQCKTQILRCFPFQLLTKAGRLFYDGCYLRYDDYDFFDESLTSVQRTVCDRGNEFSGNQSLFRQNVEQLVRNLSLVGPRNNGFAVGFVNRGNLTVYGLGQCWEFVNRSGCASCLANSAKSIVSCSPKVEGRVLNSGCYMRYSLQKFYDNSTDPAPTGNGGGSNRLAVALASAFGSLALLLFVALILYLTRRRIVKHRREKKQLGTLLATINKSNLNFSYETLEKATDYFRDSNKLGVGGSGSVFKGILPDGRTVAIKRLLFNTRQWVDHFFNEVNLISGIDHKNLVRLLGCSITGPESLLVYEFVPNQSLHDHLFGRKKARSLTWEERCKIILGTAEGLAYLHEESKLRIIHRDIKLSNILLDTDFTAKIADFGLARLFPQDQTHISTAIAGTLGYMAPEYVVHGKLSEKADVYSFGVLVIEVVTGRRNNSFSQNSTSILQMVWTLYGTGRVLETVDTSLEGRFREDEASRLLQVGLLCAQASAELRPSMSGVVKMLTDMECEVPQPAQPPFLNASSSSFNRPGIYFRQQDSNTQSSGNSMTESLIEPR